jgi:aspartate aminotransferase
MSAISPQAAALLGQSRRTTRVLPPGAIRLDSGDPDIDTPEPIRRAMAAALERGITHYAPPAGEPILAARLAMEATARGGAACETSQVIVTHGASAALTTAMLATVGPGDRVLIPEPTYSLYTDIVHFAGGQPQNVTRTRDGFRLDLDAIAAAAPGAKMIVICNPNNPTGTVDTADELKAVCEIAMRHGLFILSDEAYESIVFDGRPFTSLLQFGEVADRLIYVQTFSKTCAMTGWRLGFVIAPKEVAPACQRVHAMLNGAINPAIQYAALAGKSECGPWIERNRNEYQKRRDLVVAALNEGGRQRVRSPEGTFYAWIRHGSVRTSDEMHQLALQHGVSLRSGREFGPSGEGYLRLAFSTGGEKLAAGLQRLLAALAEAGA